ncbi:hypothetical protein F5Y05DRAFT_378698 [Hypoxylon sp. FL0543]|nr:hypothetical protein F5Y05DRAFT_378698 [Hypoxylon sp. FL0543]
MSKMGPLQPTFHLFSWLPFELRREIYILATPPRIVHVRESWDIEDHEDLARFCHENRYPNDDESKVAYVFKKFRERYQNETLKTKLHPDLAYFAHNWRGRIPFSSGMHRQMALESYGITSSSALRHQPWLPTDDSPEIPLRWLQDHLDVAFELIRDSYLCSAAPIPPLLHTCTESRKVLMDYGYRIVFGTRTRGPRTWFHFGRDRLYIAQRYTSRSWVRGIEFYGDLLSGCCWDVIGQFDPKDLRLVKNLVLGQATYLASDQYVNVLRLLPNVEELFLEHWSSQSLDGWYHAADRKNQPEYQKKRDNGGAKELWRCVPAEDIDVVAQLFRCNDYYDRPGILSLTGDSLYLFDKHHESGPANVSFYDSLARQFEKELESQRNTRDEHWKLPRISFVDTCPETIARRFVDGRLQFWRYYTELRKAYGKEKPFIPLTVDSPTPPPPFQVYWNSKMDESDWDFFTSGQEIDVGILHSYGNHEDPLNIELRGWYLANVSAVEPSIEIL